MAWRVALLLFSLLSMGISGDVYFHKEFNSGVVINGAHPEYSIRCAQVDFQSHQTLVTILIRDNSQSPQFTFFKETLEQPNASEALYVPAAFNRQGGELYARTWDVPDLVLYTKPENDIHEAKVTIYFEPLWKLREDELNVDEVKLRFPGFSQFAVTRVHPVSQGQDLSTTLNNALINSMGLGTAAWLNLIGMLGLVALVAEIALNWEMLVYRWKVSQRERREEKYSTTNSNGDEMPQSEKSNDVLIPPKWDENLITLELDKLQGRASALSAFTNGVITRHIIRQADKTAKSRIAFLRSCLEQLQVSKQLQAELDDLAFRDSELEIRRLQKEVQKADLEHQRRVQQDLREAEHKRDLLKIQVETAKLKKEAREFNRRPTKEVPVHKETPEERAAKIKARLARARQEKAEAQRITDPEERQRCENQWDDRIADLEDELSQFV